MTFKVTELMDSLHPTVEETISERTECRRAGPGRLDRGRVPREQVRREIAPRSDLVERELIRVLDLLVLRRARTGRWRRSSSPIWTERDRGVPGLGDGVAMLLSEDDVIAVAEAIEPGSSAAVLVWEN